MNNIVPFQVRQTNISVIDYQWFTGNEQIGIVLCEDNYTHQTMCYIGTATGVDEQHDAEHIAQWGSKLPKGVAESLFGPQMHYKYL